MVFIFWLFHFLLPEIISLVARSSISFYKKFHFYTIDTEINYVGGDEMQHGKKECAVPQNFNFMPLGQAIKQARESRGITREQLAEMLDYAPRHLQSIENEGQHPSLQLFVQLVTMFDISVDKYLFPQRDAQTGFARRQADAMLNCLNERELSVVEATARGLLAARSYEE